MLCGNPAGIQNLLWAIASQLMEGHVFLLESFELMRQLRKQFQDKL